MHEQQEEQRFGATSTSTLPPPLPHELTAEWTVRAQLTFARAGERVRREYSTNDPVNPVRVVYKWTNLDGNAAPQTHESIEKPTTPTASRWSRQSTPLKPTNSMKRSHSFRSTCSSMGQSTGLDCTGPDSAFSNSNSTKLSTRTIKPNSNGVTAAYYGTRCQSTCNIVVSAVADFLPSDGTDLINEEEPDPYTFNTNASCTVLPQKSFDDLTAPETPRRTACGRVLALVDATCQTSDTETKYFEEQRNNLLQKPQHSRKYYDQRRATAEALLTPEADEAHNNLPSYTASPTQTFKSASMTRLAGLAGLTGLAGFPQTGAEAQKKPRTVHIDVYCTGSEDEQADGEGSSSGSEMDRHYEMESNSTPKTVFANDEMQLRHQRMTGKQLPRRLLQTQTQPQQKQQEQPHRRVEPEEEISESKQMLLRKHIGERNVSKLEGLRQKYIRQSSEEMSSYANSSRSTARDYTGSSLHSDMVDGINRELDYRKVSKSDSFDYDNSLDRLRIKRMERFWSRSLGSSGYAASMDEQTQGGTVEPTTEHYQTPSHLQTISERNSSMQRFDTMSDNEQISELTSNNSPVQQVQQQQVSSSTVDSPPVEQSYLSQNAHFSQNRPGFLQFFGPVPDACSTAPVQELVTPPQFLAEVPVTVAQYAQAGPVRARWRSETREISASEVPTTRSVQQSPLSARRFEMQRDSPSSVRSESSSAAPPGYTREYLQKARKFGKVVAARKPGHHVGPTKNPTCSCESCQRWLAERFQIRARAFSLGECPVLKRPTK